MTCCSVFRKRLETLKGQEIANLINGDVPLVPVLLPVTMAQSVAQMLPLPLELHPDAAGIDYQRIAISGEETSGVRKSH